MFKDQPDPLGQAVADYIDVLEGKKPAAEAQVNGEQELTNEQRKRVPYIVALYRMPCVLCNAEPPCTFFLPWKTADTEAPWSITAVCSPCRANYGQAIYKAIEARLREDLNGDQH